MARIRADYVFGTVTNDPALLVGGTTLTSAELVRLPAVTSPDVAAITLHDAEAGTYEIVHVTAHTAAANSATILRAQEGTAAQEWPAGTTWLHGLTVDDVEALAAGGGGGGGGILATHAYDPASATVPVLATSETDVDATNLAVTFTAPSSGSVVVSCSILGIATPPTGSGSIVITFSFREGSTTVPGTSSRIFLLAADDKALQARVLHKAKVTGLTPGSTHTYKLAAWNSGTGTGNVGYGGGLGQALFEVQSA